MENKYINYLKSILRLPLTVKQLHQKSIERNYDLKNPKVIVGKLLSELNNQKKEISSLHDVEFQVFSQWGDDGIIQYLINKLDINNKTFIEFGVENYLESNTRFLLLNNNWSGLVIDGSSDNVDFIKQDHVSWAHELFSTAAFITKDNINQHITSFLSHGFDKEIGILSIDIDGNDYWIWKEINTVNPIMVIVEYNSIFGSQNPWTINYKDDFVRGNYNSNLFIYYGASLLSLCDLAEEKGYYFIGCNSSGNNAYFVRKDKIGGLKPLKAEEGYVYSKFREAIDVNGNRISGNDRYKTLIGKDIFNTRRKTLEKIS